MGVVVREGLPRAVSRGLRVVLVALVGTSVAACGAAPKPNAGNSDGVSLFLARSFADIRERPLEEPGLSDLAFAGLGKLSEIDGSITVAQLNGITTVNLGGQEIHRFRNPGPTAVEEWGRVTANALIAAYERSVLLRAQEPSHLYDVFMRGAVPLLGDGATYRTAEEYDWLVSWQHYHVDILYQSVENGIEILKLDMDGDLEPAGLKVGDVITHVDGQETTGRGGDWRFFAGRLLNGSSRTPSTLTVQREGVLEPFDVTVKRKRVHQEPWELDVRDGFVDFKVWHIGFTAVQRLEETLSAYPHPESHWNMPNDAVLNGVLIDLRPGAKRPWDRDLADSRFAEALAAIFLSDGMTVARKLGRPGGFNITTKATRQDASEGAPLVILIDGSTAGSSEVFAAALQDNGRALVIGTTSVGFGTQGAGATMPHGGVFGVPAMYVFAPSGYRIEGRGVLPNICTSTLGASLEGILAGLRRDEGMTDTAAKMRHIEPGDTEALTAHRALCPAEPDTDKLAYELGVAILKDPDLYMRLLKAGAGS